MFAAWGSWVARFRWPVFVAALAAVIAAGVWGVGVFGQLSEGGYNDPGSESTRAAEVVQEALGAQGGDVVVIYTPASGRIDDAVLAERVAARLDRLPADAVSATTSYWAADRAPQYASADRRSAVAVLTLAGDDDSAKLESFRAIDDQLEVSGARTQVAGAAVLGDASSRLSTRDLAFAEAISLPVVLILLLLVFGSLVAAALPVVVGGAAVLGSLGVLHAIALSHNVNSFAVNVASLLGLGMAIDYGLFMVGRFREEQGYGRTPAEAVTRTVATAGRTVLFSATLLMIALAGLLLFPQGFLKSLAYGGLAAVALAAALSLTLLPALLAILGPRVDKLPIRLPRRRTARPAGTGWARLADVVLRHPVLVVVPLLAGLLVLAAPIRGVHFGETDERVLPAAEPARQAIEALKADFPALSSAGIQVVLRGTRGDAPEKDATEDFAARLERVRGIAEVTPAGSGDEVVVFTATTAATDPFSDAARDSVADIRALRPPADTELLVGGATARNVDSLEATADRLPLMIGLLVGATLVLMFLAFGSILLPIKAVVVSALSLTATFGILVWIFQDGHGAGLLQVTPAPLEVGIVVLMAAVVFGLSTDYEVFLLSRMVEARTRGATTAEAVTTGLARTGRVISAAALLLIVVTGAFALSSVTTMRFVGVGMIIALVLDATVVRMLLVPAVLRLMGDAAWWAPGPMRRLQERAGLAEYAGEELFPTVSVGRHAAPDDAVARSSAAPPRHASRAEPPLAGAGPVSPAASPASVSPAGPPASVPLPVPVSPATPSTARVGAARAVSGTAAVPSVPITPGADDEDQPPTLRIPTGEQAAVDDRSAIRVGTGEKPASRITEQPSVHFLTGEPGAEVASGPEIPATPPAAPSPAQPSPAQPSPASPSPAGSASARPVRVPTGEQPSVGVAAVPRGGPATPPRPALNETAGATGPGQATPGPTPTSPPAPGPATTGPATSRSATTQSETTSSATTGPATTSSAPTSSATTRSTTTGPATTGSAPTSSATTRSVTTESATTGLGTAGADAQGHPPIGPDAPETDPRSPDLRPTTDLTGRGPDPDPRHDPGDNPAPGPDPETTAVLEARPTVDLSSRRTPGNPDQA